MGTASSAACSPHLPGGRCLELTEERVPPGPGDEEGAPTPHGPLGVLLRHDHLLRGRPAPNTRRPLPQPPRVCGATTSRSSAWRERTQRKIDTIRPVAPDVISISSRPPPPLLSILVLFDLGSGSYRGNREENSRQGNEIMAEYAGSTPNRTRIAEYGEPG
jgi:hypothetical protein